MEPTATTHIEVRPNLDGQPRAFISGTRVRVQDIYVDSEIHGKTPDQIVASLPELNLAQVHAALAYYFDDRDRILAELREDTGFVKGMRSLTGPGPLESKSSKDTGT